MCFSWSPRLLYHLSGCCRGGLQRGYKCEDGRHAAVGTLKTFHEDVNFFMVGIFGEFLGVPKTNWPKTPEGICFFAAEVAGFHSFVGLAAVFAGFASYFNPINGYSVMKALETAKLVQA